MSKESKYCLNCLMLFKPVRNTLGMFCSNKCQQEKRYESYIERWLNGEEPGWSGKTRKLSNHIRRWIRQNLGTACQHCGWDERHPKDGGILTEIDHIDGDAENCKSSNLRVLCPNCHSKTFTFRARNKGSKRNRR